jgi:8-oxo-dGTP diphosphatase
MKKIHKIGLIILKDKKLLINRKKGTKLFLLPGGKPEKCETDIDCLKREVKEEHDVEVAGSLQPFGEFIDKAANEQAKVHIKAYIGRVKGNPRPRNEIEEQRWFSKHDDPSILSPILKYKVVPALLMENLL